MKYASSVCNVSCIAMKLEKQSFDIRLSRVPFINLGFTFYFIIMRKKNKSSPFRRSNKPRSLKERGCELIDYSLTFGEYSQLVCLLMEKRAFIWCHVSGL